jgi:2-keto-3-deoxy-galactonokinase
MNESARLRNERRRLRDRRAQAAVVLLALLAGLLAGMLGTRRGWERLPPPPAPASVATQPDPSVP